MFLDKLPKYIDYSERDKYCQRLMVFPLTKPIDNKWFDFMENTREKVAKMMGIPPDYLRPIGDRGLGGSSHGI